MAARARVALIALIAVLSLVAAGGSASASGLSAPFGFTTPDGSFIIPYSQTLLGANAFSPHDLVFGDVLLLEFINPLGNRTISVTSFQNGTPGVWLNQSYAVLGHAISIITFDLPSTTITLPTQLCVDEGCIQFLHKTPVTLLPAGIVSVGGLDVLAFAITLETLLLMAPLTVFARYLGRKALWSPNIKWWLVVPHLITGALLGVAAEFPLLDSFFGGFEFVIFPIIIAVLFFFWEIHLFNIATPAEAFRPDPRNWHDLNFYRWRIIVGDLPDGRKILIGTRWRDWLARLFGHAPVIVDPNSDPKAVIPSSARLVTQRSETRDERRDRLHRYWKQFRSKPGRASPFDSFQVVNASVLEYREKDPPRLLYWVDSDHWLDVTMPYLTMHRDVTVPAELSRDGQVVKPARTKRKLTLPHYVDPPIVASLSGIHWKDSVAAAVGWIPPERAFRRLEEMQRAFYALQSSLYVLADEKTEIAAKEIFSLLDRERFGISLEEAEEEARHGKEEKGTSEPERKRDATPGEDTTEED